MFAEVAHSEGAAELEVENLFLTLSPKN